MTPVDTFLAALDPKRRAMIETLRAIVIAAAPSLHERIKWNAPSFAVRGQDLITLGLEHKGGVRVVLHRGATVKDATGFRFEDPDGLATWASPDRGILIFDDVDAIVDRTPALFRLFQRWIDATG